MGLLKDFWLEDIDGGLSLWLIIYLPMKKVCASLEAREVVYDMILP